MRIERILVQVPRGIPPKMVKQYVDRCLKTLPDAVAALGRSDYAYLRIFGHRLKGTGGAYGIPGLTDIGSAIEAAARRDETPELKSQIAALEACLSRIEVISG